MNMTMTSLELSELRHGCPPFCTAWTWSILQYYVSLGFFLVLVRLDIGEVKFKLSI